MPIAVLHTMTTMNSMFLYEPVTSTNTARITLMALNSVSVFSRTIWRTERVRTPAIHVHLAAGNPLLYLCRAQPARLHLFVHASKLLTLRGRPAPARFASL